MREKKSGRKSVQMYVYVCVCVCLCVVYVFLCKYDFVHIQIFSNWNIQLKIDKIILRYIAVARLEW